MVGTAILRTQTEEEKKDYRELGKQTPLSLFRKKLTEVEVTFTKAHKPFDAQCARIDFQDKLEDVEKESERVHGYVRLKDVEGIDFGNLNSYGDEDRFEMIGDDEDRQDKVMEGMRTQVIIGHTIKYICKQRGHGISVFLPNDVYKERFGKEDEVKEKK